MLHGDNCIGNNGKQKGALLLVITLILEREQKY